MSLSTLSVRARLAAAVNAVIPSIFGHAGRRSARKRRTPPTQRELRAECEALEQRRLLNGVTRYISPPYFVVYVDYSFMHEWKDCCGISHGISAYLNAMLRNDGAAAASYIHAGVSTWPVRYLDGQPMVSATDIDSGGFGQTWGQTRTWNDPAGSANDKTVVGNHWAIVQMPQLVQQSGNYAVIDDGQSQRWFVPEPGNTFTEEGVPTGDTMRYDSNSGDYIVTDAVGDQEWFSAPGTTAGQLVKYFDPQNNATTFSYNGSNQLTEVQRANGNAVESWHYFYYTSGSVGELSAVVLRRSTTGSINPNWTDIREADYAYWQSTDSPAYGNQNDLKSVTIRVGAANDNVPGTGAVIGTTFYRYYTPADEGTIGYQGGLRYVFEPDAYARAKAAGYDPATSSNDAQLQLYATNYFEYDNYANPGVTGASDHMVVKEIAHGGGCSCSADGGQGVYTYAYQGSTYSPYSDGYDNWKMRSTVNLPDGNTEIVYSNYAGEPLLDVQKETSTGRQWLTAYHYDSNGNLLWEAHPSAFVNVSGAYYSESYPDLVNYQASTNTATYLSANSGLIDANDYYSVGWTMSGSAGVASNNSNISGSIAAHDGQQAAFLKDTTGLISQTFTASAGANYTLNFWGAYVSGSGTAPTLQVLLDGNALSPTYALTTSYTSYSATLNNLSAGTHTIAFQTASGTGTALIDATSLTGTGAPSLSDPSFESPTLAAGTYTNDPLGSTASATAAGGVTGFAQDRKVQQGLAGTPIIQQQWAYLSVGGGTSAQTTPSNVRYLPGTDTVYGQTGSADPRTTTFSYTFDPGTTQIQQQTTTMPPIPYGQDGPAASSTDTANADIITTYYDAYGRVQWTKDGDGHVNYNSYVTAEDGTGLDTGTGAVTETITDVKYSSLTSYEKGLFPSGWTQPTSGLNIITTYAVDGLGRTTQQVRDAGQPDAETTDTVYNDANHETRVYPGWHQIPNTSTYTTTGPMQVSREYFPSTIVSGTATGGSQSTLTDTVHLSSTGAYVGLTLSITGGTDAGQTATVTGYNGATQTLTFSPSFGSNIDTTSTYVVGSRLYDESLTVTAPVESTSTPSGTETIDQTDIQALSRQLTNGGGQVVEQDDYFSFSGVTYSASAMYLGSSSNNTASGNYHATLYGYDDRGRRNMVKMPTGTIYNTVYDDLGHAVSLWVGTNDTPTSGEWSPTNNSSPCNMIDVQDNAYDNGSAPGAPSVSSASGGTLQDTVYYVRVTSVSSGVESPGSAEMVIDVPQNSLLVVTPPSGLTQYNVYVSTTPGAEELQNSSPLSVSSNPTWTEPTTGLVSGAIINLGGVGDGNLTQVTMHPGSTDPNHVTQMIYDFRDRSVARKSGVQPTEDTNTHRPIVYNWLDNLGEVQATYQYDGDQVSLSDFASTATTDSAPTADATKLRAKTVYNYDDQGRVYETQTYSVDRSSGNATNPLNSFKWYDHRGNLIKTMAVGGLVQKYLYDGADRPTTVYTSDGGGDTAPGPSNNSWSTATSIGSNIVLSQAETQYDAFGNTIFVADRERMHDDPSTDTGALGTPTSGNPARVYYSADYYDAANRMTDSVNFGTNQGTAMTSPPALGSIPSWALHTVYGYRGDNVQTVTITGSPTGGTFTLTFNGQTTGALAYNAPANSGIGNVQGALAGLSTIGANNVTVTGPNGGPYLIRFTGTLAESPQSQITATSSLNGGTNPSVVAVTTNLGGDSGRQQKTVDPRGIITKSDLDMLGRTVLVDAGHTTGGAPAASIDQTTTYTYNGDNHTLTMTAQVPGANNETTQWSYNTTPTGGYQVRDNDRLKKVSLPDPSTGNANGNSNNSYTYFYDNLGEPYYDVSDPNGSQTSFTFDVLGRMTQDNAAGLGTNVDSSVRSLVYGFDTNGQLSTASSYSGTSGAGALLNQVEEQYNGYGQVTGEWQSHSGAVNTNNPPQVQYNYTYGSNSSTGQTYSRLTSMTYPNGRQLDFVYNSGLDSNISRVSGLSDDSGTGAGNIESYSYLGLSTIVQRNRPNGVNLTLARLSTSEGTGDGGDEYIGLDRFGRIVDQRWTTSGGTAADRFQYGYDQDGNVLYKNNLVFSLASELYHPNGTGNGLGYDALNRIVSFTRGTLTASNGTLDTVTVANQDTNLPQHTETWNLDALGNWTGSSAISIDGTNQSRTVDSRNRYTAVGSAPVTSDNIGNVTQDETGLKYVYDIWNRVVKVENSTGGVLETYTYDAFGRRITETPNGQTTKDLYFDASKVIEEQQAGTTTNQYVWGLGYVNSLVLRDDNSSGGNYGKTGSGLGRRLFVQQDADWNITSLTDTSGNVQERFVYDPYGRVQVVDKSTWNSSTDSFNWLYHFQGGRQDSISGLVHFGTPGRDYSTTLGRWTEPDSGYIDGANVYQGDGSNPVANTDPKGAYIEGIAGALIGGFFFGIEQELLSLFMGLGDIWTGAGGGSRAPVLWVNGGESYMSDGSGGAIVFSPGLLGIGSGLGGWGRYPGIGMGIHPGAQPQETLFAQGANGGPTSQPSPPATQPTTGPSGPFFGGAPLFGDGSGISFPFCVPTPPTKQEPQKPIDFNKLPPLPDHMFPWYFQPGPTQSPIIIEGGLGAGPGDAGSGFIGGVLNGQLYNQGGTYAYGQIWGRGNFSSPHLGDFNFWRANSSQCGVGLNFGHRDYKYDWSFSLGASVTYTNNGNKVEVTGGAQLGIQF